MQPVVRALRLLTALAQQKSALTLQELAELQGLPVSTVHRLVGVLQAEGYLARSRRGKLYFLGPAVRGLVSSMSSDVVRRIADPMVRQLNSSTGETVIMVELVGSEAVCFSIREGRRPLRMYVELGTKLPLHAASSARVLLSDFDNATARQLLESHGALQRWTERTIIDVDEVIEHLDLVRARGYDICDDEMENAIWAVAAPLVDASGAIRSAIAVVAPIQSVEDDERRSTLRDAVVLAAKRISDELGANLLDQPSVS
jgi:DNA-binding IclR family transcriptional regulator